MNRLFLAICLALLNGCAFYNRSPLMPDSFNYTYAADQQMKPAGHWFGVSWQLKRSP
jgi:hypothetical protein